MFAASDRRAVAGKKRRMRVGKCNAPKIEYEH
jgi:hypothetical protein